MAESSSPKARKRDKTASPSCPHCDELAREVAALRQRCDEALRELASERERANALYLAFPPETLFTEEAAVVSPLLYDLPLRYRIADKVNAAVKAIPGVHGAGKLAAGGLFAALKKLTRR